MSRTRLASDIAVNLIHYDWWEAHSEIIIHLWGHEYVYFKGLPSPLPSQTGGCEKIKT